MKMHKITSIEHSISEFLETELSNILMQLDAYDEVDLRKAYRSLQRRFYGLNPNSPQAFKLGLVITVLRQAIIEKA